MYYEVKVRPEYRWSIVQVGGKIFSKVTATPVSQAAMTDEIMHSALLEVLEKDIGEPIEDGEIDATIAAVELAEIEGVNLANVTGSGSGGRITKSDVEVYLNARNSA